MKQFIIAVLLILQASVLFAQQEKKYIKQGNDLYQQQNYKDAEKNYRLSVGKKNQTVEGNFNLGDALYKQKRYEDAGKQFDKIAASSGNNKAVLAKAYHNLGNSFLESKKLEESVAAYKKSLLNNPTDEETRYNLAYAQEKLKQKQNQDKNNKNNKNNKDKNKDKNKDQNNKDKDKDKDKNKDDKNKDDKQNPDKNNQDKKDQGQQDQKPDPNNVSKDDAERMLEAFNNDEKQTQDKLKNKKIKGARMNIEKDW
ncbi:MAG: tetratricopeptide repeat protein [Mucilaginibacter sp.]|uniref:tetratricopeptide repeat protein n=1 Tax=Mucilaginibacter sp. TaxID=1882438 RepID=UPI0031B22DAD